MVTAKAVGLALVVASASCCDVADTVEVRVTQVPAEVVVSPSSYTLKEGESHHFTAVVKDGMGYVIPQSQVTWSLSDSSIASVDEVGYVTGHSGGTTLIRSHHGSLWDEGTVSVNEPVAPPGDASEAFFWDGFESGDRSSPGGMGKWESSANAGVREEEAYSPPFSLRFRYDDGKPWSEQRYDQGKSLEEMWVEAYVRVPENYKKNSGNDKFLFAWHDGDYPGGGAQTSWLISLYRGSSSDYGTFGLMWADNTHVMKSSWEVRAVDAITPAQHGKWIQLRVHAKLGLGGGTNADSDPRAGTGVFKLWWDGVKIIDVQDLSWDPTDRPFFRKGYLMGWSNAGYDQLTYWYWDDIKFYDTDPDW